MESLSDMEEYKSLDIQELPLSVPLFRRKVERFLESNGLRMEEMARYLAFFDSAGEIVAGAGIGGNVIKCVAVSPRMRGEGLVASLVSHLISSEAAQGRTEFRVFTKPDYAAVFADMGFRILAAAPEAVLMENGKGLERWCSYLESLRSAGPSAVVVMNANPLTRGHLYLIGKALEDGFRHVFVIPVKEENGGFSYARRKALLEAAVGGPDGAAAGRVTVCEGSDYVISGLTFPTYFLKDLSSASRVQMRLDLDLFLRHIAPALGVQARIAGSEPSDPLTAAYNALMAELLPSAGLEFREYPRLCQPGASGLKPSSSPEAGPVPVSASLVRASLDAGNLGPAVRMAAPEALPFLLGKLAGRALMLELDAPLKPGLVGPDGPGAHKDMDYLSLARSAYAIEEAFGQVWTECFGPFRPYSRSRSGNSSRTGECFKPGTDEICNFGLALEKLSLAATGGVNAHRGAIFALGLTALAYAVLACSAWACGEAPKVAAGDLGICIAALAAGIASPGDSHGARAASLFGAKGALAMAKDGYGPLFGQWLPYYEKHKEEKYARQKTLLLIMSGLDDTCVIHRGGPLRAQRLKAEAGRLFQDLDAGEGKDASDGKDAVEALEGFCRTLAGEGLSPGGCADMLALTIFTESILRHNYD